MEAIESEQNSSESTVESSKPKIEDESELKEPNSGRSKASKNQIRKLRNYEMKRKIRLDKRQIERERLKRDGLRKKRPHRNEKELLDAKLRESLENEDRIVVIDCQYDDFMSIKEKRRFAQQLRRVYSSNRANLRPIHLILSSLNKDSSFYKICCQMNSGFQNYVIDVKEDSFLEIFRNRIENIVYLSPDAEESLISFDPSKIYVIGGIVDETTQKNLSKNFIDKNRLRTARLPIKETLDQLGKGTSKTILTINQVFDIILKWYETKDWNLSLISNVPSRTGFKGKYSK